jgi:AraC-like DNA-binding protein
VSERVQESVTARPAGRLGLVVAEHHGYRLRHGLPAQHRGLPSPFLTLIFTLDDPLRISRHVDPSRAPGVYPTVAGGLHSAPALIQHDGAQSGIQLQLSPLAARALFGMPAGELSGLDVCASEVLGSTALCVQARLAQAGTWPERFALLDHELGRRLDMPCRPAAEVCQAWRMLRRTAGGASIAAVAREVGWSERHLTRQFELEIGLTPKLAARVIRFDRARRILPHRLGADVASRCGYADQSHMVRDFVAFAGLSPSQWLAAEVGNLQVGAATVG